MHLAMLALGDGGRGGTFGEKQSNFHPRDKMIGKKNQILHPEANKTQE